MSLINSVLSPVSPIRDRHAQHSNGRRTVEFVDQEENIAAIGQRPPASVAVKLAASTANPTGRSTASELASLARHEADLQQYLQGLLDAQATGLLAGVGNEADSEKSETDSVTSGSSVRHQDPWNSSYHDQDPAGTMAHSVRSSIRDSSSASVLGTNRNSKGGIMPIRQPQPQTLSLRAARREIRQTMLSLSATKRREKKLLQEGIDGRENTVSWIISWQTKRDGLQKEMEEIKNTSDGERARQLKQENTSLTEQIHVLEMQLAELKSQQRATVHELGTLENSVQAKLSSYQGSLAMLDRDIKTFLKQARPDAGPLAIAVSRSRRGDKQAAKAQSMWELPHSRRTLEMAVDEMERDKAELSEWRISTDEEIAALRDGARMWSDTVQLVTTFEKALQQQLQRPPPPPDSSGETDDATTRIVQQLESVIEQVEESYQMAEQKGWNLLICCIGAELEALRQGHELLVPHPAKNASFHSQSSSAATIQPFPLDLGDRDAPAQGGADDGDYGSNSSNADGPIAGYRASSSGANSPLKKSLSAAAAATGKSPASSRFAMREDDEPDPDLLVSTTHDEF